MKLQRIILLSLVSLGWLGIAGWAQAQSLSGSDVPSIQGQIAQSTDPAAIAQQFVTQLATGQYTAAVQSYDPTVSSTVTPQTLQATWSDLVDRNGAFRGVRGTQVLQNDASGTVVLVNSQFEQATKDVFVVLSGDRIINFSAVQ